MQIIFNSSEVESIVSEHVSNYLTGLEPEDVINVTLNADGSASISIGEEDNEDTPPVVEKKTRKRREAKHVMVEKKEEKPVSEPAVQGEEVVDPNDGIHEEAVAQAEETASEEASEKAAVAEEVQEKEVERPASSKPSLFANLKR